MEETGSARITDAKREGQLNEVISVRQGEMEVKSIILLLLVVLGGHAHRGFFCF